MDVMPIIQSDYTQAEKVVWMTIDQLAGEDGWCDKTHQEIADVMGTGRSLVSRTIAKMKRDGWLKADGRKLMCSIVTEECDHKAQCDHESQSDVPNKHKNVTNSHKDVPNEHKAEDSDSPLPPSSSSPAPSPSSPPLSPSSSPTAASKQNHRRSQGEKASSEQASEGLEVDLGFIPEHHNHLVDEIEGEIRNIRSGRSDLMKLARHYLAKKGRASPSSTVAKHKRKHGTVKTAAAYVIAGLTAESNPLKYASTILDADFSPRKEEHASRNGHEAADEDKYAELFDG